MPFSVFTPAGVPPPELLLESLLSDELELSDDAGALGWLASGVLFEELLSELLELWEEELDEPEL